MKVLVIYDLDPAWDKKEIKDARRSNRMLYESLKSEGIETFIEEVTGPELDRILDKYNPEDTIVFNLCETLPGIQLSEKKVVEIIESKGFTYTGNTPEVIDLSYNKQKTKRILSSIGVTVPHGAVLSLQQAEKWTLFPAIVKPSLEHCSLTLTEKSVVYDTQSLKEQIRKVNQELKQPALVEDFIDGREFHVSVWNNLAPEMLPPVEMDFSAFRETNKKLCTYDSKFTPGSEHYEKIESVVPAPIDEELYAQMERESLKAWKGFGCMDYARFDFRLRDDKLYLLDVNPNNDISFDASFAMAAEVLNYSYSRMVKQIVLMAAERHPVYAEKILTFSE
ncbi:MAG: D-alanine--D-alanine ligase [Bacteroidales bacterium]|nr:D-alanine--D-alanine ligase [Bacteroidales bacterium]